MKRIKLFLILTLIFFYGGCASKPDDRGDGFKTEQAESFNEEIMVEPARADGINSTETSGPAKYGGYFFSRGGVEIILGEIAADVIDRLGPEIDFYEYASCAFDGDSKMYVYGGFEISTYVKSGEDFDRIYSVTLNDDSVETSEGLYIGNTYGVMTDAYGNDYEEIPGVYLYRKDGTILSFTVDEKIITSITYYIEDIYS